MDVLRLDTWLEALVAWDALWPDFMWNRTIDPTLRISAAITFLDSLLKLVIHSVLVVHARGGMNRIVCS
jgi:hypothetical protein